MDNKTIYDLLKEMREDQKEHGKSIQESEKVLVKQSEQLGAVQKDIEQMKIDVADNKDGLLEHMRRTDILEKLHENAQKLHIDNAKKIYELEKLHIDNSKRIEKLEEPQKAKDWLKKNYLNVVSIITATASILALFTKLLSWW